MIMTRFPAGTPLKDSHSLDRLQKSAPRPRSVRPRSLWWVSRSLGCLFGVLGGSEPRKREPPLASPKSQSLSPMSSKVLIAVLLLAVAVIGSEVCLMLLRVGSFFAFSGSILCLGLAIRTHAALSLASFPVSHLFLARISSLLKKCHCCVLVMSCCGFLFVF